MLDNGYVGLASKSFRSSDDGFVSTVLLVHVLNTETRSTIARAI
jgi:hypothetical protein